LSRIRSLLMGECGLSSLQIVQAVADRPEPGLVVTAVDRDGPCRVLDCCGRLSERHHLPALQQPDQAGLVVAAQACVAGVRMRWSGVQAEQVAGRPAERLGLLPPASQEPSAVLKGSLPAGHWDEVGAAGFQNLEDAAERMRNF